MHTTSPKSAALSSVLLSCFLGVLACGDAREGESSPSALEPLGLPGAVFPEDFGYIHAVRELPDGAVLVPDPVGGVLYRTDMDAGVRTVVGGMGEGPGEYLQPDAVWPLPGDSTLLVDLGTARLVRLGPGLEFGSTHPIAMLAGDGGMVAAIPQGVDARGNVYAPVSGGYPPPDSGAIARIDPVAASIETVGSYKRGEVTIEESEGRVRASLIPLSPGDAWGVAADGAVVVARSEDYGVDWLDGGAVTRGVDIAYDPVPITAAEKLAYLDDRRRHAGIGMEVMTAAGGPTETRFYRGSSGRSAGLGPDDYTWPDAKPAPVAGTVRVDPLGRAWVRRHTASNAGSAYDLFDRRGRRMRAVTMEGHRIVVGFGPESVYVAAFDALDRAFLERYDLPPD